ncbi:leucine-rich repeat-containing protein 74B-like [Gigantopelta aegis]|uniref:leucine-rich repeat-containing protein 74B-like n=1 Tax=Gigantopelta aegis TaxID=1735272 RepID=UPI001B888D8C|nr:leucine-rich repeat-containing protein 74B-like [Gigantopelta aegis]
MHALALLPQRLKPKRQGSRHQVAPETSKRGFSSARYGSMSSSISLRMLTCTGRKSSDVDENKMKVSDIDALEPFDGVADILKSSPVSISRTVYQRACARLQLVPSRHVYCRLEQTEIHLPNCFLGAREVKAIAIALVHNNTVHTLDLHGNDLGPKGLTFIVEMLQENRTIIDLNLSGTSLREGGAEIIANGLVKNTSIVKLNISDNDFQENDALYVSEFMQKSKTLRELNLSHNCFREEAGVLIGKAIAVNCSLRTLDLSWNHLRLIGAEAICRGLKVNRSLIRLFLSWNGFGIEGCYEMSKALRENKTLIELDLSANRVNIMAFRVLLRGLLHNNTLRVLKIGVNPITTDGAISILHAMDEDDATALIELDLSDVSVDEDFLQLLKRVQTNRPLQVKYGVALRHDDIKRGGGDSVVLDTDDPASLLFEYMRKKNLRLIDLLSSLDKDNSLSLDREELRTGLLNHDIPLSSRSMDIMMTKLDRNQDGFVDYEELATALKEYTRRLSKRQKKFGKKSLPVIDQLENLRQKIRLRLESSGEQEESHGREWHI